MSAAKRGREGFEARRTKTRAEQFRGTAYDGRTGRKLRGPWTASLAEARAWRIDTQSGLRAGSISGERGPILREAVETFIAGIESSAIRNRSGQAYKPSVLRDYRRDLRHRIVPLVGATRLTDLTLPDMQRVADRLAADGLAASSVRNAIMALRALYAWARPRGLAMHNPCDGLRLSNASGSPRPTRRRCSSAHCVRTIAQRSPSPCTRGCAQGSCSRSTGPPSISTATQSTLNVAGITAPVRSSRRSPQPPRAARDVPMVERLRVLLLDHRDGTTGSGLLFPAVGRTDRPVSYSGLVKRMQATWQASGLERLGLHEARHTFASMLIDAGANAKAITTYMGHGSIQITFDRYGHLMPGHETEVRGLLDRYLA